MQRICSSAARIAVCALLAGATSACAAGRVDQAPPMALGGATPAPLGFLELCERAPEECTSQSGANGRLTPGDADTIRHMARSQFWSAAFQMQAAAPSSVGSRAFAETVIGSDHAGSRDRGPGVAASRGSVVGDLALTAELRHLLDTVNSRINGSIVQRSDRSLYGVADYWATPIGSGARAGGDCEDYVLEKRRALIGAGVPAAALSIAIVKTDWNEVHAVLLVATEKGEIVLDNLKPRLSFWTEKHYRWLERQAAGAPLQWVSVAEVAGQR